MVYRYNGHDKLEAFLEATADILTVSPGGAAIILGVSRERVRQLYTEKDNIRSWHWWDDASRMASCVEVSLEDLFRWAIRTRGIRSPEHLNMGSPRITEEFERALALEGLTLENGPATISK